MEPASSTETAPYNGDCELPPYWLTPLGFVPGDYAFTVEGNAYALRPQTTPTQADQASNPAAATGILLSTNPSDTPSTKSPSLDAAVSDAKGGAVPAHHFSETKTLHVGLSQLTTLLAAMIGAFLAYWVTALKPNQDWDAFIRVLEPDTGVLPGGIPLPRSTTRQKLFAGLSLIRNAVLAAILGGVVTIVASRLSDTHFPLKVSVSDWWGALTIGFVAYFFGNKFIDSLSSLGSSNLGSNLGKPPAPLAPAPAPVPAPAAPVPAPAPAPPVSVRAE